MSLVSVGCWNKRTILILESSLTSLSGDVGTVDWLSGLLELQSDMERFFKSCDKLYNENEGLYKGPGYEDFKVK